MSEKMVSLAEEVERMKRFDAAVAEALKGARLLLGRDGRAGENLSGFSPLTPFQERMRDVEKEVMRMTKGEKEMQILVMAETLRKMFSGEMKEEMGLSMVKWNKVLKKLEKGVALLLAERREREAIDRSLDEAERSAVDKFGKEVLEGSLGDLVKWVARKPMWEIHDLRIPYGGKMVAIRVARID